MIVLCHTKKLWVIDREILRYVTFDFSHNVFFWFHELQLWQSYESEMFQVVDHVTLGFVADFPRSSTRDFRRVFSM